MVDINKFEKLSSILFFFGDLQWLVLLQQEGKKWDTPWMLCQHWIIIIILGNIVVVINIISCDYDSVFFFLCTCCWSFFTSALLHIFWSKRSQFHDDIPFVAKCTVGQGTNTLYITCCESSCQTQQNLELFTSDKLFVSMIAIKYENQFLVLIFYDNGDALELLSLV